jgi:Zn-dependent peptidase ImmA (M78 family)/transcriptional regulator with XRE-family HTH domain
MAISNYEKGIRRPDMALLRQMADVLGVRVSDFLAIRDKNLIFCHGEFRKKSTLSLTQQQYLRECVEEHFNRFMSVVEILGGDVLPEAPTLGVLELTGDSEADAQLLRKHLHLAEDGPISNLTEILENKGILLYACAVDNDKFSGMNGSVNGRPYIVFNENMSPERNRSTIVHELAHLMFRHNKMHSSGVEETTTAISGAFLFPKSDAIRELGVHRTVISKDMLLIAQEYGISMFMLVKRAQIAGIISPSVAKQFYVKAASAGWRKNEPSRINKESPLLFKQLVYRAVNENEISVQRGAELLKVSYSEVASHCSLAEVDK